MFSYLTRSFAVLILLPSALLAQIVTIPGTGNWSTTEDVIPTEVEEMFQKGMNFLVASQNPDGSWNDGGYGHATGVVGLCVVSLLAHGEDPNYGPYSKTIKQGVDYIIQAQNENGYLGVTHGMYSHGFATLALAECYGVVDDPRIGPALQAAVDLLVTSQKNNSQGAWRYSPEDTSSADTTVAGAQMVALFAARNAGIFVPDEAFERGVEYYNRMQSADGGMGYSSPGGSNIPRSAIGLLVYSLARVMEEEETQDCLAYCTDNLEVEDGGHPFYSRYYMSQALFQADYEAFLRWNSRNIRLLSVAQLPDGSWNGSSGSSLTTAFSLLSLALNYRLLPIYER